MTHITARLITRLVVFPFISTALETTWPTSTATSTLASSSALQPPPIPAPTLLPLLPGITNIPQSVVNCWQSHANYSVTALWLEEHKQSYGQWHQSFHPLPTPEIHTYTSTYPDDCSSTLVGLTTLCDGYPRGEWEERHCATKTGSSATTRTATLLEDSLPWAPMITLPPSPTCTVAPNFGAECKALADAFNSLTESYLGAQPNASTSALRESLVREAPPCTALLNNHPSGVRPTCSLKKWKYEAWYWPTPTPTGPNGFCQNGTNITITSTATSPIRTTVVSGHTLTSPSVYHFLRNVELETVDGTLSKVGADPTIVWHTTTIATADPLTVAQRETDILRQTVRCGGSGSKKHCVFYYKKDFTAADMKTVRAENVEKIHGVVDGTIVQDLYRPTIGVPFEEVSKQNGEVELANDCDWTSYFNGWRITQNPDSFVTAVGREDFHEIGTTTQEAKPTKSDDEYQ